MESLGNIKTFKCSKCGSMDLRIEELKGSVHPVCNNCGATNNAIKKANRKLLEEQIKNNKSLDNIKKFKCSKCGSMNLRIVELGLGNIHPVCNDCGKQGNAIKKADRKLLEEQIKDFEKSKNNKSNENNKLNENNKSKESSISISKQQCDICNHLNEKVSQGEVHTLKLGSKSINICTKHLEELKEKIEKQLKQ